MKDIARKLQFIFVVLCFLGLLIACRSEAYTYADPKSRTQSGAGGQNDPYLAKLLSQYPEHEKIFAKLYDSYSGWVIDLTEKYGEAPILAMNEAREDEYNVLFKEPGIFIDLYQAMESVQSKSKRAYLALRLANAMSLTDPAQDYAKELERARAADAAVSRNGKPSHRYMDAFFAKGLFPDNLLSELKKEPDKYAVLLDAFAKADDAVLESAAKYPNAIAFLLNAGPDGIKLIEETNGEAVFLSYVMTNESLTALPALFKKHRLLASALASCGAEAFPVIMEAPEFYFALASSFSGEVYNSYYVAYVILDNMLAAENAEEFMTARNFLNGLSLDEARRIARLTAELIEVSSSNADGESALVIAPFVDPYYIQFVQKYDRDAIDICAEFGDLNMAALLMKDWKGGSRDISPVIRAILEYNYENPWGLCAAMMFKYSEHVQSVILAPEFSSRSKELLMLLFYDSFMYLSANIGSTKESAEKLLDDYRAESGTGKPISIDGGKIRFREFVPGYDATKAVYDMVRYGKTPTVGEVLFAALDVAQLLPMMIGSATLIKSISTGGIKKVPGYLSKMGKNSVTKLANIPSALKGGVDDSLDALRKFSLPQLRRQAGSMADYAASAMKVSKADVWALVSNFSKLRPGADTLSDLWSASRKFAAGTKSGIVYAARPIAQWADDFIHMYPKLRSGPWMTKHATEAVVEGFVVEGALQPALLYTGVLSIFNYIESQQAALKILK